HGLVDAWRGARSDAAAGDLTRLREISPHLARSSMQITRPSATTTASRKLASAAVLSSRTTGVGAPIAPILPLSLPQLQPRQRRLPAEPLGHGMLEVLCWIGRESME